MNGEKSPADPGVQAWLNRVRAATRQPALQPRRPLQVAAEEIGSLEDGLAAQLPDGVMQAHGVALRQQAGHWHLQGEGDATALLNALARVLRACGHSGPWRDEQLAVCNPAGEVVATVEEIPASRTNCFSTPMRPTLGDNLPAVGTGPCPA